MGRLDRRCGASLKRFACGDVIPGCGGVFTGAGDQSVLDQVLAHVAADHGLGRPLPFIELVMAHTHPFVPTRNGHLRVVDPDAGRRVDTTDPRRPGNQFTLDGDRDARVVNRSSAVSTAGTNGPMPGNVRRLEPGQPRPGKAHGTYRHECVLYAGTGGFLDAAVPFVRDGLARQEPVMVAVAEPRLRALRSALGEDAERVVFADMADLGHNPALIIPAWRDFTDRYSGTGRPVRGIGEPIWATRPLAEIVEAQLHEALLNMAVPPDVPLWLLCPYDTGALDEQVLAEAHRSHPVIVDSGDYRGSTRVRRHLSCRRALRCRPPRPRRTRHHHRLRPPRARPCPTDPPVSRGRGGGRRPGSETRRCGRRDCRGR